MKISEAFIYIATTNTKAPSTKIENCYQFRITNNGASDFKYNFLGQTQTLGVGQFIEFLAAPGTVFPLIELSFNLQGVNSRVTITATKVNG